MDKQLYRSRRNRVFFGVCGGFGEYFGIDPTIVRVITVVLALTGMSILVYIIAAIVMPDETKSSYTYTPNSNDWGTGTGSKTDNFSGGSYSEPNFDEGRNVWDRPAEKQESGKSRSIIGVLLVGLGVILFGRQFLPVLFNATVMVPLLLIGIGGYIIYKGRR